MASETLEQKRPHEDVLPQEKAASAEGDEEKETSDNVEKDLTEAEATEEEKQSEEKGVPSEEVKGSRKRSSKKSAAAAGESKKSGEESTPKQPRKRSLGSKEAVTPVDRPARERKSVERYSASEKAPAAKVLSIEKGRGTQLKDIPNVAFKLSKRKPDENMQMLHTILYGKKAKVHMLKKNISQFSGYVWLQNEEKQRAKIKEKLDKFVKEKLLDFCDVLDIPVSKANTKKEELSAKLLEFLESPHATTEVSLADKEQSKKGKKRKRKASAGTKITSGSGSNKKRKESPEAMKKQKRISEVEEEVEDDDEPGSAGTRGNSDEGNDSEKEESDVGASESEKEEDKTTEQMESVKGSTKKMKGSEAKTRAKATPVKKGTPTKSVKPLAKSTKGSSASALKKDAADDDRVSASPTKSKASRTKKQADDDKRSAKHSNTSVKGKSPSKNQPSKSVAKASVREKGEGKASKNAKAEPSREEMHAVVTDIVKEVDFNTATLSDIIRQLGTHFDMDLMHRKSEVKSIIEDVINNMTDEEDDGADGEDDDNTEQADDEADDKAGEDNDD